MATHAYGGASAPPRGPSREIAAGCALAGGVLLSVAAYAGFVLAHGVALGGQCGFGGLFSCGAIPPRLYRGLALLTSGAGLLVLLGAVGLWALPGAHRPIGLLTGLGALAALPLALFTGSPALSLVLLIACALGLLGGALEWRFVPGGPGAYGSVGWRACLRCGQIVGPYAQYCPRCGNPLP